MQTTETKIPQTGGLWWLKQQIRLIALEARKSKFKVPAASQSGEGFPPDLRTALSAVESSCGGRDKGAVWDLL